MRLGSSEGNSANVLVGSMLRKILNMYYVCALCNQSALSFMRFANSFVPRLVYKPAFWDVLLFDMIPTEWP